MDTINIGKKFEEKAKENLIKEGYEIIEESSKLNWQSPYDFIVRKKEDGRIYFVESRGRNNIKNGFSSFLNKNKKIRLNKYKEVKLILMNPNEYILIDLKDLNELKNKKYDIKVEDNKISFKGIPFRGNKNVVLFCIPKKVNEILDIIKKIKDAKLKKKFYQLKVTLEEING